MAHIIENLNLNEQMLRSLHVAKDTNVPVFFLSNPGFGKTTLINWYAEKMGMKLVMLRGSDYQPEDVLGFPKDSEGSLVRLEPQWYRDLFWDDTEKKVPNKKPCLLFIDELTTASPYTQSALLSVIFERKLVDKKLPEDTFIVAAGNYSMNLTDQFDLISPIVNRFMFINLVATNEDIDLFLGLLENYTPFDPSLHEKMPLSEESKLDVSKKIANLVRDLNVNLNETDLKDIYRNRDYVINACTPRSLHYLNKVCISIIENNLMHPMLVRTMVDGLFGYGVTDFGVKVYSKIKDITPEGYISLNKIVDFSTLKTEDFINRTTGARTDLFKSMTGEDFMKVKSDVFEDIINIFVGDKLMGNNKSDLITPEEAMVLEEKAKLDPIHYELWEVLIGRKNPTDLKN